MRRGRSGWLDLIEVCVGVRVCVWVEREGTTTYVTITGPVLKHQNTTLLLAANSGKL